MRIALAAVIAVSVGGLAVTADAAPARKKQYAAAKEKVQPTRAPREAEYGYDNSPDHYPVGSNEWWRAMDREGRGGCCGTTN